MFEQVYVTIQLLLVSDVQFNSFIKGASFNTAVARDCGVPVSLISGVDLIVANRRERRRRSALGLNGAIVTFAVSPLKAASMDDVRGTVCWIYLSVCGCGFAFSGGWVALCEERDTKTGVWPVRLRGQWRSRRKAAKPPRSRE